LRERFWRFYSSPPEWGFLVLRHFKRDIEEYPYLTIERPQKTQLKEPEKGFKGPSNGPSESILGIKQKGGEEHMFLVALVYCVTLLTLTVIAACQRLRKRFGHERSLSLA
jgi:hypothetical protein